MDLPIIVEMPESPLRPEIRRYLILEGFYQLYIETCLANLGAAYFRSDQIETPVVNLENVING
jgi:hypothetical protein